MTGSPPHGGREVPSVTGTWSDAPADLLWKIIERLPTADYIRFGAVCVSWRSALSENRRPPAHQIPFLLLSGETNCVSFLSLSDDKEYHIDLPTIFPGHKLIGSSGRWLVTIVAKSSELHLLSPFSASTHLRLPSVTTIFTSGRYQPTQTTAIDPHDCFRKVVVSPTSPATAAVICSHSGSLALARSGDDSWNTTFNVSFTDTIFYRNQLYAMCYNGLVVAFDLSDVSHPKVTHTVQPPRMTHDLDGRKHLVVSSNGDDLLLVYRLIECEDVCRPVQLFKMMGPPVVSDASWFEVESLGDEALFLGHNSKGQSLALSVKEFPELRRNCIYFSHKQESYVSG